MAYSINSKPVTVPQWNNATMGKDVDYQFHEPKPNSIVLNTGHGSDEMIRITPDGFYVRGVRVPADEHEAETVYLAFKEWLVWANLQRR
jgi:hypothetical protein